MKDEGTLFNEIAAAFEAAVAKPNGPVRNPRERMCFATGYRAATENEGFRPGLYQHYKGGRYRALMLVNHHDTREPMVVYVSLSHGTMNVREYRRRASERDGSVDMSVDAWTDMVRPEGSFRDEPALVPRFKYIGP